MKFILLLSICFFNCLLVKGQVLQINGKVFNTDTKSILLIKPNQDTRFDSILKIPVKDGKFYYKTKLKNKEVVNLAFAESVEKGAYRPMPLFLENEKIDLTIYPEDDFEKNIVNGGKLNAQYAKFKQSIESKFKNRLRPLQDSLNVLFEKDEYYSDKMKALYVELSKAESQDVKIVIYKKIDYFRKVGSYLSPKAKILEDKLKLIYDDQKKVKQEYIENNPTIVSYSFLLEDLIFNKETIDIELAQHTFQILSKVNPNHPYNELASNLISAIENIKIKKKNIDFSAPDLNGNIINLSNKIKGKVALLDLWATWCGPCIAKSRTMIPIYNEFKDKGFIIIGVAGEFKNTDNLVKRLEKEKWPWLNLVELDRKNDIWVKYGVNGGGGGIFLIDENGNILDEDPTAEEVRKELEFRLN